MLPGRTLDINQKEDRPLPNLFNFTALFLGSKLLRYRMTGITESAMVAYTHKYAVV